MRIGGQKVANPVARRRTYPRFHLRRPATPSQSRSHLAFFTDHSPGRKRSVRSKQVTSGSRNEARRTGFVSSGSLRGLDLRSGVGSFPTFPVTLAMLPSAFGADASPFSCFGRVGLCDPARSRVPCRRWQPWAGNSGKGADRHCIRFCRRVVSACVRLPTLKKTRPGCRRLATWQGRGSQAARRPNGLGGA